MPALEALEAIPAFFWSFLSPHGSMTIGSTVARFKVKPADCFSSVMEAVNAPVMHAMLQNTAFSCASKDGA